MSILSNLFNGGDVDSGSSLDLISDIDGALGLEFSNESFQQTIDEDGSSSTSYDSTHFGTDLDFGSILGGMLDNVTDSDGFSL